MNPCTYLRLPAAAVILMLFTKTLLAQSACQFSDDFSSSDGWTQVGQLVTIQTGLVQYRNGAADSEQRRIFKNIGTTLDAGETWSANIDFLPVSVGDYGGPHAGHAILSLTAGTQEPFSDCPDVPCTGYPAPRQDAIICMFGSPGNPSDGNSYFILHAVEGSDASEYVSTPIQANALGVPYYVHLERVSATLTRLSVFSDAGRTTHLPGSPVDLVIPASIEGLNTVQHGNIARGGWYRELSGEVDNLCIRWADNETCPPDRLLGGVAGSSININTGVDENLNVLPFGTIDPRWTIVGSTLPPMSTLDRWNFTPVASQWIGFDNNQGSSETNYQVRFDFCTEKCGDYRLDFRMLADNGACVYLDGVLVPSNWWLGNVPIPDCNFNPGDQSPFIPTAGYGIDHTLYLSGGIHTLEIDVTNFAGSLTSINILGKIETVNAQDCPCTPGRTLPAVVGSSININTGVDENLNVLPFGTIDPRWTIVGSTLPPMSTLDRWNFTPVASQWIGFDNNQGSNETNYQVRFSFCTDTCGDYYRLNFRMLADNGACVYLDGVLLPSNWWLGNVPIPDCNFNPGDQSPFIPTAGYVIDHTLQLSSGNHILEIDVVNFSGSLTSINVQGSIELEQTRDSCIVGVNDSDTFLKNVQLFPNPAQDMVSVYWKNETPVNLYLVDVLGRNFRILDVPANGEQIDVSLEGMQPGTYFLVWQDRSGRIFSRHFVKI
ncbi:MAG TPA: T9SS type A sorting domain-containing protein [Saprospiraceae bacterium]|nr:T9SS type A sorting domain-containing protein [Saprospiraceae bacterium]